MMTGFRGTFVISWHQTETDGVQAAAIDTLNIGASWRWSGEPVRIDGPSDILVLDDPIGAAELRRRATKTVQAIVGAGLASRSGRERQTHDEDGPDLGFVVTDGRRTYPITVIRSSREARPLLMFSGEAPPSDTELWVVATTLEAGTVPHHRDHGAGVICFTQDTLIAMQEGVKPVQDIVAGDRILTKDDGAQEILWVGSRRMSGARLYAMPQLRPIRIRAGALGDGEPEEDLLVSPHHRVLLKGKTAELLFNTPEVLVAAQDLVNDHSILVDYEVRDVTYFHVMTERHQVVWANGVETESFHPANTLLQTLDQAHRERLFSLRPELEGDPHTYGDYARRNLSRSEAALFTHGG